MRPATYGDLFEYLMVQNDRRTTDPFFHTRCFLREHGVSATRVIEVLEGFGGYDDQEVVLNAADRIAADTLLSESVETPMEYATRHDLRVYADDGWSYPDLNAALSRMSQEALG